MLLMAVLLAGCGADDNDDHRVVYVSVATTEIPKAVNHYGDYAALVDEFKTLVEGATGTRPEDKITTIEWAAESEGLTWASCIKYVVDATDEIVSAKIELDPNLRGQSETLVRVVMLHELGHCIMNSHHIDDTTDLMSPRVSKKVTEQQVETKISNYLTRLKEGV
jgi:hypothetical protein